MHENNKYLQNRLVIILLLVWVLDKSHLLSITPLLSRVDTREERWENRIFVPID